MVQADGGFGSDLDGDHGNNWHFVLVVGAVEVMLPGALASENFGQSIKGYGRASDHRANIGPVFRGWVVIPYKLYRLNKDGRVTGPPQIVRCEDDDAVLKEARKYVDGHAIEVWRYNNRVGLIPADE